MSKLKPYPVCEGKGLVPYGFYTAPESTISTAVEVCRTCCGRGIIEIFPLDEIHKQYGINETEK
jgi:hypothetical protein